MSQHCPLSIEDRLDIHDLLARYAWALDTGDVEALVACFATDCEVVEEVFEEPDRWQGKDGVRQLAEHYRNALGFPGRQHHVSQVLIQGDGACCTVKSFAFVTECHGEPPYTLRFTGYYDDSLIKRDGAWLFARRVIRLWDGPVLARFPGHGAWVPRKRPPELRVHRAQQDVT